MPVTDKQYMAMESCYLSASDKLLRLRVEHERLQARNKVLTKACMCAFKVIKELPYGTETENKLRQALGLTCPLSEKMV
jgi:hypothetical protein